MNLVYRYYRSMCTTASRQKDRNKKVNSNPRAARYKVGDLSWYGYFAKLAMYNKNLIMKHCKIVDVEDAYTRTCVRKLPLTKECDARVAEACKFCPFNDNTRFAFNDPETIVNRYSGCLQCWISVLEDPKANIDREKDLPAFLRTKELPKFLR